MWVPQRLIHLPADSIQNWAIRRDEVLRDVKELAQNAVEPTIFLFNVGPLRCMDFALMFSCVPLCLKS